jgi:hypothetical protein
VRGKVENPVGLELGPEQTIPPGLGTKCQQDSIPLCQPRNRSCLVTCAVQPAQPGPSAEVC